MYKTYIISLGGIPAVQFVDLAKPDLIDPPDSLGINGFVAPNYLYIRVQNTFYPEALGVSGKSRLRYQIGGCGGQFSCLVGIPDESFAADTVDFWVFADGKPVGCALHVRRGKPRTISCALFHARSLELVTSGTAKAGLWLTPSLCSEDRLWIVSPTSEGRAQAMDLPQSCAAIGIVSDTDAVDLWVQSTQQMPEEWARVAIHPYQEPNLASMLLAQSIIPIAAEGDPASLIWSVARLLPADRFIIANNTRLKPGAERLAAPLNFYKASPALFVRSESDEINTNLVVANRLALLRVESAALEHMPSLRQLKSADLFEIAGVPPILWRDTEAFVEAHN